jgi:hypothetical protein
MRALRSIVLFAVAIVLAYVAGWQLPGDGLALPAGLASAVSLLVALA